MRSGIAAPRALRYWLLWCAALLTACAPAPTRVSHTVPETSLLAASPEAVLDDVRNDDILDVLTFNAALLPELLLRTRQYTRAKALAQHLVGYNVVVLQEVFIGSLRDRILEELTDAYPYRTDVVGNAGAGGMPLRLDGGVIILSRWPIVRHSFMTFGETCSGWDCMSDTGVAYAAVRKGRFTYHVFGTHAQSDVGPTAPAVRTDQFAMWRSFMEDLCIPETEPVLLAGDLNVDAYGPEIDSLLEALNAVRPMTYGPHRYTWDYHNNTTTDFPGAFWLDYVLHSAAHAQPKAAWNRVVPLRDGDLDLSDHFAVWGRIVMGLDAEPATDLACSA